MRSAMRAASQLPGRGPVLWILPLYLHVNPKSDDDDELRPAKFSNVYILLYITKTKSIS